MQTMANVDWVVHRMCSWCCPAKNVNEMILLFTSSDAAIARLLHIASRAPAAYVGHLCRKCSQAVCTYTASWQNPAASSSALREQERQQQADSYLGFNIIRD